MPATVARSGKVALATRLLQTRGNRATALRVAVGDSVVPPPDLASCRDPRKMTREELVRDILQPALEARWLRFKHERLFRERLEKLETEQVRQWACEVLKEHPWPPGFHVPTFREFVTGKEYLDETFAPTERQTRAFQEALGESAYDWFVYRRKINLLCLVWGKGSGKDWLSACILAYVAYTVGHMRHPWFHFGVSEGSTLDCINVAESKQLAQDVFFGYLSQMLKQPCFEAILQPKDILTERVLFWRQVPGRKAKLRALRLLSLNSKSEAVEGKNTFLWVMDEADAFKTAEGHQNAREMFTKLTSSNRFGDQQIGIAISYSRSKNGFILSLYMECGNVLGPDGEYGKRKNAWGDRAATWEVLPFKVFQPCPTPMPDPLNPGRMIEEAYTNPAGNVGRTPDTAMHAMWEHDPEEFNRVYACSPPAAEDAFITFPEKITEAVEAGRYACLEPVATFQVEQRIDRVSGQEYRYIAKRLLSLNLRPGITYYLAGDAGSKQDSFALALFHIVPPNEAGFICPACWVDRKKRWAKHYTPEERSALAGPPQHYACDHCGLAPHPEEDFWGVSKPAGRVVQRPVVSHYNAAGHPVYAQEQVYDEATGRWAGQPQVEEVFFPLVVEDLLLEWQPDRREGIVVDFENVTEIILQLHETGQIGFARFDQWQAEEKIQRLRRAGLPADTKQLSNPEQLKQMRNYKDLLYGNLVWLLSNAKRDRELSELQDINGTKMDHPKEAAGGGRGSKDLVDAEAMAIQLACEKGANPGVILTSRSDRAARALQQQGQRRARQQASIVGNVLRELKVRS